AVLRIPSPLRPQERLTIACDHLRDSFRFGVAFHLVDSSSCWVSAASRPSSGGLYLPLPQGFTGASVAPAPPWQADCVVCGVWCYVSDWCLPARSPPGCRVHQIPGYYRLLVRISASVPLVR